MEILGALTGSLIGALIVIAVYGFIFISAFLSALGIFRAGTGFYQKVKNDTRMALYNKTFDVYRDYNHIIHNYINLINTDNNFDLKNPQYKEEHEKLRFSSGEILLLADNNLRRQISNFTNFSFSLSHDKETEKNMNEVKQELLKYLIALQEAIKCHLDNLKPSIDIKKLKVY